MAEPHSSSLHFGFATEGASVLGMPANVNLLHHFPERGTITSPEFADELNPLGVFSYVSAGGLQSQRESDPFIVMSTNHCMN